MARSRGEILDLERDFPLEELFFSTTDLNGVIVHGNELFARISGYNEAELIGSPHSVIRHPDMPRAIFDLLWETIQAGKTIAAYVKNLAKDGRYYWVLAVVMPCKVGYLSIRLKPTSPLLSAAQQMYARLLQVERTIEVEPKKRKAAIVASREEATRLLQASGFPTYEAFMLEALSVEMASRHTKIGQAKHSATNFYQTSGPFASIYYQCQGLDTKLMDAYERIGEFKEMNVTLLQKSSSILSLAEQIRTLSLNATITASQMGHRGTTLRVVSESLGSVSCDSQDLTKALTERVLSVVNTADQLIFDLASTKLQSEVSLQFVREIIQRHNSVCDYETFQSLEILFSEMTQRVNSVFDHLKCAEQSMVELKTHITRLARNNKTLRFVQFAGMKECIGWSESESFSEVFQQVRRQIDQTKAACDTLGESVNSAYAEVKRLLISRESLQPYMTSLQDFQCHTSESNANGLNSFEVAAY